MAYDDMAYDNIDGEYDVELDEDEGEIEFDPGTLALMDRARRLLEQPNLDGKLASKISAVIDEITDAVTQNDNQTAQAFCDDLIDLLFEAEE